MTDEPTTPVDQPESQVITSFPDRTNSRRNALLNYMHAQVLDGGRFICSSEAACRASVPVFHPGQLSYVGKHYDLERGGKGFRIVIVGQEYGTAEERVDLDERTQQIVGSAALPFSGRRPPFGRNPHMKGTTSLLRLLHGRKLGEDVEGERLFDGHLFDGFALVNFLLCSGLKTARPENPQGAGQGASSRVMRANCSRHFKRTLEILEPTLVIAQGAGVRRWIGQAFNLPARKTGVEVVALGNHHFNLLTFYHPSAGGSAGWWGNSVGARYLTDTVAPTVREYIRSQLS